jgi:16S rRNA (guanine527-N7)-methyltransferase
LAEEELLAEGLEQLGITPEGPLIDSFMIYLREISLWNGKVRLVSDPDPRTVAVRHVLDSLAPQRIVDGLPRRAADAGAGGGFPGIPLALVFPDLELLLVERKTKKAAFLRSVVGLLGLKERVEVVEGDVQEVCRRVPLVVCRAFRPVSEALELVRPILPEDGGSILVYGGKRSFIESELRGMNAYRGRVFDEPGPSEPRIIPLHVPFLEEERNALLFSFPPGG